MSQDKQRTTIATERPGTTFDYELPAFPTTASSLLSALQSQSVDVGQVTKLIECDPVISSKVLSLANSPLYAPARPISTINHAIVLLGFNSVSQLVLTIATGTLFSADEYTAGRKFSHEMERLQKAFILVVLCLLHVTCLRIVYTFKKIQAYLFSHETCF